MNRRHFMGLAGMPLLQLQPRPAKNHRIEAVEIWKFEGSRQVTPGRNVQYQVQPLHIYDEFRPDEYRELPQPPRTGRTSALYLKVRASDGLEGIYGPIDKEAAIVVDQQLRTF